MTGWQLAGAFLIAAFLLGGYALWRGQAIRVMMKAFGVAVHLETKHRPW